VVLLGDAVDSAQASVVAHKLLNALREPVPVAGMALVIDASIGVSNFPEDGQSASELLAHADRAMYAIKALGAGGVGFIGQVMPGDASGPLRARRLVTIIDPKQDRKAAPRCWTRRRPGARAAPTSPGRPATF
jgi:GGDEF domain-containing protein